MENYKSNGFDALLAAKTEVEASLSIESPASRDCDSAMSVQGILTQMSKTFSAQLSAMPNSMSTLSDKTEIETNRVANSTG